MQYIWSNIELLDRVQNEAPELCLFCGGYVCLSTFCFSSLHLSSLSSKECKCTFCFLFTFVLFLGCWGRVRHFPCPCSSRTSANQIKAQWQAQWPWKGPEAIGEKYILYQVIQHPGFSQSKRENHRTHELQKSVF